MKQRFAGMVMVSICLFLLLAAGSVMLMEKRIGENGAENSLVILNGIRQLTSLDEGENPAQKEIGQLEELLKQESGQGQKSVVRQIAAVCVIFTVLCMLLWSGYIYVKILRPFYKLERYADQIAKGNMDLPLEVERTNFFGAFTWAFDHMRKEITDAREREKSAVCENKTIIATLSHDIKTPIASIRAYAEGLEANLEADFEQRERYVQVIIRKCDEVTRLTNDLVLHSLSELEHLTINQQKVDIRKTLMETLQDLEYPYVALRQPLTEAWILGDEKRIAQVILNLIENAQKYAPDTKVEVWAVLCESRYEIHVRDYGNGILPEDMPFIFDKFYRGKNVGDKPGSGLGLYIVNYIMEKMGGGVLIHNHEDGLEVVVWLPYNYFQNS